MKKLFVALFLIIGAAGFAGQTTYVSHYSNGTDEVQTAISPLDGNMYVIVNGVHQFVFEAAGISDSGILWHSDSFGDLLFTLDCKTLFIREYSSGRYLTFYHMYTHAEILP